MILSFGIGQILPVDDVRCIVEDYLATPDEHDYEPYKCVACGAKHKSYQTNLCADHREICLLCRGSTGSKKKLVCLNCSHNQDVDWIWMLEIDTSRIFDVFTQTHRFNPLFLIGQKRSWLYFQWYCVKVFPSRFWPKANSATAARRQRESEDIARRVTFFIGEMIKPADQRIAELTRKLYEANEIINSLRKPTHDAAQSHPRVIATVPMRPEFPFF